MFVVWPVGLAFWVFGNWRWVDSRLRLCGPGHGFRIWHTELMRWNI